MESVGLRNEIKVCCAKALWKLSTWSLLICKKVTEKKGSSKVLEEECALSTLENLARPVLSLHPNLREVFAKAIYHLTLYQSGVQLHGQPLDL
ncbi:hypothetical protein Lal_00006694 [Lupinus albus]|nr:hypothetical protein Lal_00006694 [Lupinus albus]